MAMTANEYYYNATKGRYRQFNGSNQKYIEDRLAQRLKTNINERVEKEFTEQGADFIDKVVDRIDLHFKKNPIKW